MASVQVPVRLYRHSLDQAWGFRLQGEHGSPLSVLRVFAGGVADGNLNRGDEVVAIDNCDVTNTSLQQAEQLVSQAGRELLLVVKRQAVQHTAQHSAVSAHSASYPFEFHGGLEDYDHAQNINQLRDKFNHSAEENFDTPVRGKVQINARPGNVSYVPKKITIFSKPPEFGWSPNSPSTHSPATHSPHHHQSSRHPLPTHSSHHHPPSTHSPKPSHHSHHHNPPPVRQVLSQADQLSSYNQVPDSQHSAYEKPAWLGTLKSSTGLKPWEIQESNSILGNVPAHFPHPPSHSPHPPSHHHQPPHDDSALSSVHQPKVQMTHISPSSTTYQQHSPHHHPPSDTARIQHAQYNTPLGLYSFQNATNVLDLQTADKPGSGTLKIVSHGTSQAYSPQHSDVYKLLKEEEGDRRAKRRSQNLSINQQPAIHHSTSYQSLTHHSINNYQHDNHYQPPTHQPATKPSAFSHYADAVLGVSDF